MTATKLKEDINTLIADIEDTRLLSECLSSLSGVLHEKINGVGLTPTQQQELELSIEESYEETNLVTHSEVMDKYEKQTVIFE